MDDTELESRLQKLQTNMKNGFAQIKKTIEQPFQEYSQAIQELRANLQALKDQSPATGNISLVGPAPTETDLVKKFELLEKAVLDKAIILSPMIQYARFLFQVVQMGIGKHPKTPDEVAEFLRDEYGHGAIIYLETAEKAVKSLYMPTLEGVIHQAIASMKQSAPGVSPPIAPLPPTDLADVTDDSAGSEEPETLGDEDA